MAPENTTTNSPFHPQTPSRDQASNDLTAYSRQIKQYDRPFATAVEAHQQALLLGTAPNTTLTLQQRRQRIVDEFATTPASPNTTSTSNSDSAEKRASHPPRSPTTTTSTATSPHLHPSSCTSSANITATAHADSTAGKAAYARLMAERTLTRNGRALMGKATTEVSRACVLSFHSARTRPVGEMLSEVWGGERGGVREREGERGRLMRGGGGGG